MGLLVLTILSAGYLYRLWIEETNGDEEGEQDQRQVGGSE